MAQRSGPLRVKALRPLPGRGQARDPGRDCLHKGVSLLVLLLLLADRVLRVASLFNMDYHSGVFALAWHFSHFPVCFMISYNSTRRSLPTCL